MTPFDLVALAPSDLPWQGRILLITPGGASRLEPVLKTIRPDIALLGPHEHRQPHEWLLATGPDWLRDLATARARALTSRAIVMPEIDASSYHEFLAVPPHLVHRDDAGRFEVCQDELTEFIATFGPFFGRRANSGFEHDLTRYQPLRRATAADAEARMGTVMRRLADEFSRRDYAAALTAGPLDMWRRWLLDLYNGVQYLDYIHIEPGNVILNCGVHGGPEVPSFLAALGTEGHLVNIDPLGDDYLSEFTKKAIAAFPGRVSECRAALHDAVGTVMLPVEPGGMAAGNLIGQTLRDAKTLPFPAITVDQLAASLHLDRIDLIKMDIEGAEPRALSGAIDTIRRHRPNLAISIYHTPDQFLDIPLFLMNNLDNYAYYVRSYHWISNEVILYAVPTERPHRRREQKIAVYLTTPDRPGSGSTQQTGHIYPLLARLLSNTLGRLPWSADRRSRKSFT
jgi:FkbM family methyltransferase